MIVSRRTLLKQLALVSAGVALSPSFISCSSKPSPLFKNITITEEQVALLAIIAETIIPKTNAPGAKDALVNEYCIKMIDDCLSKKDQEKWLNGLNHFNDLVKKINNKEFGKSDASEQLKILVELDESKAEDDVNFFFKTMKQLTLRGYTTSEYYLTNVQGYKIIPGKFKGCVPVNNPS